jgi:hypothetical protein
MPPIPVPPGMQPPGMQPPGMQPPPVPLGPMPPGQRPPPGSDPTGRFPPTDRTYAGDGTGPRIDPGGNTEIIDFAADRADDDYDDYDDYDDANYDDADSDHDAPDYVSADQAPRPSPDRVGGVAGGPSADQPGDRAPERPEEDLPPGKRVRVVLSQRKGTPPRPVRAVVDVQELTQVGEMLSGSLIRSQLRLALRVGGIAAIALGAWPAIFVIFPTIGTIPIFGLRLPWLVLGVLSYPFMLGLGYWHARSAEKLEQVFADHVQN